MRVRFFPERTICNSQLFRYQPASAGFINVDADLKRGVGRGTRDGMNWEGEAPAEPERQRLAIGDWRLANGE
ncbi:hypothetical protein [Fervidibacter sp.]